MMFDHHINGNCPIAINMFEQFFELIERDEEQNRIEGFALLHAGLSSAAIISKCFFPAGKSDIELHQLRSQCLCNRYGLSSQSSIRDRVSRDNFEHFNERIDTFREAQVLNGVYTQAQLDYLSDSWVLGRVFVTCNEAILTRNKKCQTHH